MRNLVLGIESSCDDTAAALVDAAGAVVASVKVAQTEVHRPYGGVYPELASRAHVAEIVPALHQTLADAGVGVEQIRAIGVTRGPGLIGPLLVGLNTAAGLGLGWELPVIGINHLRGHLRSADLEEARVKYPATILLVSGGHTILAYMEDPASIRLLGTTRDDSVGEAYDKVGRMLGLGYPGGPAVDRLAKTGTPSIRFPRPMIQQGLDFSLSGLKSAVSRHLEQAPDPRHEDVAASFVEAILELLVTKCRRALAEQPSQSLVIVGGVAASPQLRAAAAELCAELDVELCLPPLRWATDNAAMIALATWDYIEQGQQPRPVPDVRLSIVDY
ncbi:tRNA (adenosine(37)-N6)-threonylcarbamoyltransferase complex transferase subunit TsaD [uncultured Thiohalocapsa sp.]|uniref:tRNA (adenosine(37)-N6)-threonylcarbamoyltransferase complex transferase subunit TsaD n=1 Tax=uncultured Thiohalocapsa sp. TaxID=768990 RepID=UPI0025D5FBB5|nr:tRNA (adenosine(37)-N6)-threonylcarbamoyltransferase complex transferase subunit TsaD [uncultured Thiohalocapsa sp.]